MQFIGDILPSVNEISSSPSQFKAETASVEPDMFQKMLDRNISEQAAPESKQKADEIHETKYQHPDNKENNTYKEKDISEKKNRNEHLSKKDSKETSEKKSETKENTEKVALADAKIIKTKHQNSADKAQLDLKKAKEQKKKDLTIDNFDNVMKDLDKIIHTIKTEPKETSKLYKELEGIQESLKKSVKDGLMPDLKKLSRLLELIKHELASLKKDTHEKLPQLNLLALEKKLHDIEKKIHQKRHNLKDTPGSEKEIKVTSAVIEQHIENIEKDKKDGFSAGNEKQNNDKNWNFSTVKSQTQSQADKTLNTIKNQATPPRFREQMDNILDRARVVVKDSRNAAFTLKLHPRELGSVNIHLGLEQGVLNGKFLVDTPEARNLLMQNLELVREELAQSGVSVGEFQVDVRNHQKQYEPEGEEIIHHGLSDIMQKETGSAFDINAVQWHSGSINMVI